MLTLCLTYIFSLECVAAITLLHVFSFLCSLSFISLQLLPRLPQLLRCYLLLARDDGRLGRGLMINIDHLLEEG